MVKLTKKHFLNVIKNKEIEVSDSEVVVPEMFEIIKSLDFDDDGFIQGKLEKNALWKELDDRDDNGDSDSVYYSDGTVFSAVGILANIASNLAKDEDVNRIFDRDAQKLEDIRIANEEALRVENSAPATIQKNMRATFHQTSKTGKRNQMKSGQITVNGNIYNFNSGGAGNGNLPEGTYTVTSHRWNRQDKSGMVVDGVGYSFALNDMYDERVKKTRTLLRIHPDGNGRGTAGCIGIVGNKTTQNQFRDDMRAELNRQGGRFQLIVG